ncbi:MAG: GNAT family N-acetyltransferase [Pseudomonadota bacterium]|nr:GNAT family N-acetyltransferase [Pseudomonadota bacterium]
MHLTGPNISIRKPVLADAPYYFAWWKNPDVTRYLPLAGQGHIPLEDIQAFIRRTGEPDSPELAVLIEDKKGRPIGCGGFRNFRDNAAEVSLVPGEPSLHGQGLGKEAMGLLLQYGFTELDLQKIWLIVRADNTRAIAFFRKCGFEIEEVLANTVTIDGQPKDKWRMALPREKRR